MTDALKRAAVIKGSSDGLCQESLRNTEGKHLLTPFLAPGPRAPQQDPLLFGSTIVLTIENKLNFTYKTYMIILP